MQKNLIEYFPPMHIAYFQYSHSNMPLFNPLAYLHAHMEVFFLPEKRYLFETLSFTNSSTSSALTEREREKGFRNEGMDCKPARKKKS